MTHGSHVMTHGIAQSCSDVSGFHVFHVAFKFQYLHTSAMYFCAGYIEDPWGWGRKPRNKGAKRREWWADNAHRFHGDYAPPPLPQAPSAPASGVSGVPGVSAPAVVVIDDEEEVEKRLVLVVFLGFLMFRMLLSLPTKERV